MKIFQLKPVALALSLVLFGGNFVLFSGNIAAAPILQAGGDYRFAGQSTNAYLEIDTKAFEDNITRLQNELKNSTQICAVMKADAYGNGIDLLMPSIIKLNVPCVAIASNDEARVVRHHGYTGKIVRVRLASDDEIRAAVKYDVEELVGSLSRAKAIQQIAKENNKTINVHIALNSGGMDRNGLDVSSKRGQDDALAITKLSNLNIVAIMTHYAFEDEQFVRERLALFKQQSDWLIKIANLDKNKLILHTANSFATIKVPESHLDMVRVGGLIYGDTVETSPAYQKVMAFKSKVADVQFYPKGTTVGYDGTFTLMKDSYLANLPFGYSDGYRRTFSNKGVVLINGHRVPVVSKTSMNTTMVDVTDFADINAGDEVVIYGKQKGNEISQAEIEDINGALLADLYTIWGNSNPKFIKPN